MTGGPPSTRRERRRGAAAQDSYRAETEYMLYVCTACILVNILYLLWKLVEALSSRFNTGKCMYICFPVYF
jgi:hypothetical protein